MPFYLLILDVVSYELCPGFVWFQFLNSKSFFEICAFPKRPCVKFNPSAGKLGLSCLIPGFNRGFPRWRASAARFGVHNQVDVGNEQPPQIPQIQRTRKTPGDDMCTCLSIKNGLVTSVFTKKTSILKSGFFSHWWIGFSWRKHMSNRCRWIPASWRGIPEFAPKKGAEGTSMSWEVAEDVGVLLWTQSCNRWAM